MIFIFKELFYLQFKRKTKLIITVAYLVYTGFSTYVYSLQFSMFKHQQKTLRAFIMKQAKQTA
jgi:hypothetical protein